MNIGNLYKQLENIDFSKTLYISGNRALNINDSIHNTGDWHTVEAWREDSELRDYHIMGIGDLALINTNPYLGADGIFEASSILADMGVPKFKDVVFAASHARAIADVVIAEAFDAKPLNGTKLFRFLSLYDFDDYMPEKSDKERVYSMLENAIPLLPEEQSTHVVTWLDKAKSKKYE